MARAGPSLKAKVLAKCHEQSKRSLHAPGWNTPYTNDHSPHKKNTFAKKLLQRITIQVQFFYTSEDTCLIVDIALGVIACG